MSAESALLCLALLLSPGAEATPGAESSALARGAVLAPPDEDVATWMSTTATDDAIAVLGTARSSPEVPARLAAPPAYLYRRVPQWICGTIDPVPNGSRCVDGVESHEQVTVCPDGSAGLEPLFRRALDREGVAVGIWEQVDTGGCVDPVNGVVLSAAEFRRLPLQASVPEFQPADGRGLVGVDLIVFADPAPQVLTTTVVGAAVTVRATPVQWAWDFGDGTAPLVSAEAGAPYPEQSLGHRFAVPGRYAVTLVTTWRGEYQINGSGPWLPVPGTAVTSSPPFIAEAYEAPTHLVAGPG